MAGKKAHTCHLNFPNAKYNTVHLTCDLEDTHIASGNLQLSRSKDTAFINTYVTPTGRFLPTTASSNASTLHTAPQTQYIFNLSICKTTPI
jgi:hypothetical protein